MLNVIYALLICLLGGLVKSNEEPYFVKSPEDVDVIVGNSVTLPCEATPDSGIRYYWELNGSKIANTTRRHQQGSNLHITRVDRERDSGQFTCIAEDTTGQAGAITSSPATINIQWIDEVSVQLQEPESVSFIKPGSNVVLRCHLDASGEVHFEWFRNTDHLTKSARLEIKKKKLHIKSVEASDNGVYRCVAKNEAGIQHSTTNFALVVAGNNTPLVQTVPSDIIIKKGDTAIMECFYQNADVIEWYIKDQRLENSNRISIHSNGTLQINEVGESDQGFYTCVGIKSESVENPQRYSAELKLSYIDSFSPTSFEPTLPENSRKMIGEGSTFQLTCLPPKSLPPAKKWWENQHRHTISDTGEIRVDDGRLIIENIKLENAGHYKCVAENIAGQTEKSVEVIVTSKPKITVPPESVTVDENEQSILTCEFESGSREHTVVKWRKDGKSLKHEYDETGHSHPRIKIFKQNGTLIISNTQASDRGEYVCEVVTAGHKPIFSKPATISVIEQLKFVPPPVNKKMELGSVAKVHCKAQGTPPPIIRWEKEGLPVENVSNHISDMNGTLHFNGVLTGDKGRYNCIASNSQGVINASINIDVVVAPKFSVLPKTPSEAFEGESILIDCVVEGDPKPTVQWDKNLKMNDFDLERFKVLNNGTLYISEVRKEDENKYGCTAGNSAGLNRKEVQLIVYSLDSMHSGDSTVTKAVLITMSVAGAYIILVVGLMVWCRYRRKSRKIPLGDIPKAENGDIEHTELKEPINGTSSTSVKMKLNGIDNIKEGQKSDGAETTNSQSSNHSKKSKSSLYDKLALSRTHLKELKLIGRGEFGDILISKIPKSVIANDKRHSKNLQTKSESEDKDIHVLVKSLSNTKDENCLTEFKREIDMFNKLNHEHITKLFGLCREAEPHYMILEHTDWGDLKKFLVATRSGNPPPLTTSQIITLLHQIASGMEYLANNRQVHRDLAARNCLISSLLVAKIGLPRLTRDPYSQEYCKHVNQIIPLRWLPYEAVYEDEFSTKSDVYAFGVLMWEIFAQGELPQSKINDNTFLNKLKEKKIEWKPHSSTPEELTALQESCWIMNPQERPSFGEISSQIGEVLNSCK